MGVSEAKSARQSPELLLLVASLVFALATLTEVASGTKGESLARQPTAGEDAPSTGVGGGDNVKRVRHWFRLPILIDFAAYQRLYRKSYRSAVERSARLRLYLARKQRVFVSAAKYRHFYANYYLGINTRSDWTPAELDSLQNKLVEPQAAQATRASSMRGQEQPEVNFAGAQSDPDYKPLDSLTVSRNVSRHYGHLPNRAAVGAQTASAPATGSSSTRAHLSRVTGNLRRRLIGKFGRGRAREQQPSGDKNGHQEDAVWVDHRRSGCLAEVQDQGSCGACYIFATLAYLEWAHCRETGRLVKFSEQYLVDCGASRVRGLHGCAHGLVTQVGVFVNNFGLETALGYGRDYAALQAQCPYTPSAPLASMGSVKLDMLSVLRVPLEHLEDVLEDAPLVVNIGTSRELYEYGGGVYSGSGCSKTGHHSVLLIGHGRDNGEEYWLLRNSESASYGEAGHLRLNKNSDCITPRMGFMFGRYAEGKVRILPTENPARQRQQQQQQQQQH